MNLGEINALLTISGCQMKHFGYDVAQGVALPNVTLINPFYIGPYEGYFCVCLGCHNLH